VELSVSVIILLVFEASDRFRFAVHVEVKPPGEDLLPGQAESYPRRGRCWTMPATKPRTVPAHDDFVTILVCGENLKSDSRVSKFDKVVPHRDVEMRISPYPELLPVSNTRKIGKRSMMLNSATPYMGSIRKPMRCARMAGFSPASQQKCCQWPNVTSCIENTSVQQLLNNDGGRCHE
jgi:hypothetical protein